jgi:acyl-homoserine-lactone acylase
MRVLRLLLAAGLVLGLAAPAAGYAAAVRRAEHGIPHADASELSYRPRTNLDSDTFLRSVLDNGFLRRVMDQPAPLGLDTRTRQLVDGYVAGVNRHVGEVTTRCHGAQWVRPVTAEDIARMGVRGGDGSALLVNPRFPWLGGDRMGQVQLTVPGVLNVSGVTAQRFTLYELRLVPGDPISYVVDGQSERMTGTDVTVPTGPGTVVTTKVYRSRYGPVLADGCTATRAAAVRAASADNGRACNEWVALDQDDSVAEQREALYPTELELDGSTSDRAWCNDLDAIVPGIFGPSRYPALSRADFVTNSNDSSWLTNPAAPITSKPAIYGPVGTKRLPRTQLGLTQLHERIGTGFTLVDVDELLTGERNWSADRARDAAVTMCRHDPFLSRVTAGWWR